MSVQAPHESRPFEIFRKENSVLSQFAFPTKSWIGPNQERGLFPKSHGEGLMISAFVSQDSGFGMPISDEQFVEINSFQQGTEYIDKVAATQILSTAAKQPLTELPFVKSPHWCNFGCVILFDHSQGLAQTKDCALDASSMSQTFVDVQPKMRSSKIVDVCLGPFNYTLSIRDVQTRMIFEDGDNSPWWMLSEGGRKARRHDIHAQADNVITT
jgi:hypothetical protein